MNYPENKKYVENSPVSAEKYVAEIDNEIGKGPRLPPPIIYSFKDAFELIRFKNFERNLTIKVI